jgi:hypothetical protein
VGDEKEKKEEGRREGKGVCAGTGGVRALQSAGAQNKIDTHTHQYTIPNFLCTAEKIIFEVRSTHLSL